MVVMGEARSGVRLVQMGRALARYDALFPPDLERELPWTAKAARRALMLGQQRLPAHGTAGDALAAALKELGPSTVKLGQVLAARPDLVGEEAARALAHLQDRLAPFPWTQARASIEAELGRPLETMFAKVEEQPVAAASIAQVHFAETTAGVPVAVKVLRPGIEQAFRRDLEAMALAAKWLERLAPAARRLRPREAVATLARSTMLEMDLRLEAAAAAELGARLDPAFHLTVPRVHWDLTSRRVMTLERIDGVPLGDRAALIAAGHDLPTLSARLVQSFLDQALNHGFFHADLHQGNLFVRADGTLVAVDFGIMGRLSPAMRRFMAETLLGFILSDYRRVAEVHADSGILPPGHSVEDFAQALRSVGEPIHGRPTGEISMGRLLAQLFEVTETFAMETQPQLLLLQKTMVVVEGVARSLDPQASMWEVARPVVEGWLRRNVGPEAAVGQIAGQIGHLGRRLPLLIDRAERSLATLEAGVRIHPDSLDLLLARRRTRDPWGMAAFAVAVAALLVALLS
ncbi:2-polyprenylphenol 6-hydroxylase [Zavarzinia sp. CC-PAN008]|uniref:2-polyprenylphenol 6-hydroxylase n=1 Tax=Zavarzinia sp. CC-PAN008 TaxID=3243332 RepID=UPI003F746D37